MCARMGRGRVGNRHRVPLLSRAMGRSSMSHVTCHMSHVTCHMSHVTCHMSHVTCHMSHVTCHMSLVRECCQAGRDGVENSWFWLFSIPGGALVKYWNVSRTVCKPVSRNWFFFCALEIWRPMEDYSAAEFTVSLLYLGLGNDSRDCEQKMAAVSLTKDTFFWGPIFEKV